MRTRKVDDISIALLVLSLLSGVLYAVYAYNLGLVPVIVTNGIFSAPVLIQLAYTFRFRNR